MIHLPDFISDLGLILGAAAIITLLFKWLKQPVVLGYLIAGFLVGPHFHLLPTISEIENVKVWAEIGVIFLLFSLGLEFSFKKLIQVGKPASVTALVEVTGMLLVGYVTGWLLGWSAMDSIFLGGILSISSTTIIIRAFEELGVKGHKFASLVFGILIVEDLVAIVILVLLSTYALSTHAVGTEMLISLTRLVFFLILWFVAGIFLLPTLLRKARKFLSDEMLLVLSIALCVMMAWLAALVGFSPALGAFIMGSILAETTYAEKIEHLIKPVKDLFGAVFFVSVGMLIDPVMLATYAIPIVIITIITLAGKALTTVTGSLVSGQPLKTSIQAGMSLSQIGEFSFIIATLGLTLGVTSDFLYPIAVAVSAITTFTTPYMIRLSEPLFKWTDKKLPASWKRAIQQYSSGSGERKKHSGEWQQFLRTYAVNTLLLVTLLAGIVILSSYYLLPFAIEHINTNSAKSITIVITLLVMAPFLWALAIRKPGKVVTQQAYKKTTVLLRIVRLALAILIIGFLLDRFFSQQVALIVSVILIGALLLFSRKIQSFYFQLEERFLANYHERERMENNNGTSTALAPWDAHMASVTVLPEWKDIGKTLLELAWRERFGINIAAVTRGSVLISAPGRHERIYPGDILSVIGTDEQLDQLKKELQPSQLPAERKKNEVVLENFELSSDSAFCGQTIRNSRLRELAHGIIVGVETDGKRIINPESHYIMKPGDMIWIVGDKLRLAAIKKKEGG